MQLANEMVVRLIASNAAFERAHKITSMFSGSDYERATQEVFKVLFRHTGYAE